MFGGGCFATDERLRRWPALAEKELGEATMEERSRSERVENAGAWNEHRLSCGCACQGRGLRGVGLAGPDSRKETPVQVEVHTGCKAAVGLLR